MSKPLSRVLLTNDDGVDADGLSCLVDVAETLADEVWVVAPERDQSGSSHSVSLHEPIRCRQLAERRFAVSGTPSDCVIMASQHLMRDALPDLVLSGVNRGANVSDSVAYSGTIGAAMTALVMGLPAVALSQAFRSPEPPPWHTARRHAPEIIRGLLELDRDAALCFNVNFPAVPPEAVRGRTICRQARGSIASARVEARVDTRDKPYYWFAFQHESSVVTDPDSDVAALRRDCIGISPLSLERNDTRSEALLAQRLDATAPAG